MRAVIVGCGRVGATMARTLDAAGHDVTIVDLVTRAFDRLPATFHGNAVRGDGTDEDTLRRAGAENADLFLALTEGDNRNIMSAQLAVEALGIGRVYAKVNDPVRADAYAELGVGTICRTTLMADALLAALGQPVGTEPAVREGVAHPHVAPLHESSVGATSAGLAAVGASSVKAAPVAREA
jgi:trk system potassium uptake protein